MMATVTGISGVQRQVDANGNILNETGKPILGGSGGVLSISGSTVLENGKPVYSVDASGKMGAYTPASALSTFDNPFQYRAPTTAAPVQQQGDLVIGGSAPPTTQTQTAATVAAGGLPKTVIGASGVTRQVNAQGNILNELGGAITYDGAGDKSGNPLVVGADGKLMQTGKQVGYLDAAGQVKWGQTGESAPFVDPATETKAYVPMGGSNGYQRTARENLSAMLQSGRSAIATKAQAPVSARQVIQSGAFDPGVRTVAAPVYKAPDPVTPVAISSDYLTSAINKILNPAVAATPTPAPAPTPAPTSNYEGGA